MTTPNEKRRALAPMNKILIYDVLVTWNTGWEKARLRSHSKWHRGIAAGSLTQAGNIAVARHPDVWNPQVSMCWPVYPQPKGRR